MEREVTIMKLTVTSHKDAMEMAKACMGDIYRDANDSERAGYDIWRTYQRGHWLSDLGDRLEINFDDGETVNIWIDELRDIAEYQVEDALEVISDCIYRIDDNVSHNIMKRTGIDKARELLYGAYKELSNILDDKFPGSELYAKYNL